MKIYNVYDKNGKVILSTFDEDKAWKFVNIKSGQYIDIGIDFNE